MSILRKMIIIAIIVIFAYVIYRLYQRRWELMEMRERGDKIALIEHTASYDGIIRRPVEGFANRIEGFDNPAIDKIKLANTKQITVSSYPFKNLNPYNGVRNPASAKMLRQYCIKSAYNAAYDGKTVSRDMLMYVLERGCRYLDFEVYWAEPTLPPGISPDANSHTACVSVSDDPMIPATNCITLSSVLSYLSQFAFNSIAPNREDPLFIQLRVKYLRLKDKANHQNELYETIASSLYTNFKTQLYKGTVDSKTAIDQLAKKIVIVMDSHGNREYAAVSPTLASRVNMEANSSYFSRNRYDETVARQPTQVSVDKNDGISTDIAKCQEVLPTYIDGEGMDVAFTGNVDSMSLLSNYGIQITPMMFWANDYYLEMYEDMFNQSKTGIVPLASAMEFADGKKITGKLSF